jgi:hypothetical protein
MQGEISKYFWAWKSPAGAGLGADSLVRQSARRQSLAWLQIWRPSGEARRCFMVASYALTMAAICSTTHRASANVARKINPNSQWMAVTGAGISSKSCSLAVSSSLSSQDPVSLFGSGPINLFGIVIGQILHSQVFHYETR